MNQYSYMIIILKNECKEIIIMNLSNVGFLNENNLIKSKLSLEKKYESGLVEKYKNRRIL